jgi:hypothetical protein
MNEFRGGAAIRQAPASTRVSWDDRATWER